MIRFYLSTILFFYSLVCNSQTTKKDTITIIGVGDIMMGSTYPKPVLPEQNGALLLKEVQHILKNADVTFGNLEGTLLDEGGTPKTCRDPKVCYVFKSPTHYVKNLVDAGFDIISIANNHAGDFGEAGRKSTIKTLEDAGLYHTGQLPRKLTLIWAQSTVNRHSRSLARPSAPRRCKPV